MITEYPVVLIGFSLQGGEINFFRGELVQASPHQVRMAPQKIPELFQPSVLESILVLLMQTTKGSSKIHSDGWLA